MTETELHNKTAVQTTNLPPIFASLCCLGGQDMWHGYGQCLVDTAVYIHPTLPQRAVCVVKLT